MLHLTPRLLCLLVVLLAAASPARAQHPDSRPDWERRFEEMRRELDELRAQVATESHSRDPGESAVPAHSHGGSGSPQSRLRSYRSDSSAHADDWFHDTEANLADGLTLGAYIDGLFQSVDDSSDPAANRAFLREFEIGIGAQLTDNLEGVAVVAFNEVFEEQMPGGRTSRSLEIDVEEAYMRHRWLDRRVSLRAGKLRNDFGRNNRRHTHDLIEATRPEVIRAYFNDEGLLTTGAELALTLDDGEVDSFYGDLSTTIFDPDAGGETPLFGGTGSEGPAWGARAMLGKNVLGGPLELATSYLFFATGPSSGDEANLFGVDVAWEVGPVTVEGEWMWFRGDVPAVAAAPRTADGGYLSIAYSPFANWSVGVRGDRVDAIGTGALSAGDTLRAVSGVVSWYAEDNLRVRAELQFVDVDSPGSADTEEVKFFLGFTLGLGAAHVHGVGHGHE